MPRQAPLSVDDRPLPLRERKKLRTRRALAEAAVRLFLDRGFEKTTLDELVDAVEVSKRTFFRMYPSKEAVAIAAETELWDAYVEEVAQREIRGPALAVLREAMSATVLAMGREWMRRFLATRGLAARSPAVRDHSDLTSLVVERRLVELLERKLDIDSREDVRLRLLGELALGAWRCGVRNWIRRARQTRRPGSLRGLVREVEEAFDAIPATLTLGPPETQEGSR